MTVIEQRPGPAIAEVAPVPTERPRVSVRNLSVAFETSSGVRQIVEGVSFDLEPGRCVAIVGESGSGKWVTARTIVGLTGRGARVEADALELHGRDVRSLDSRQWRSVRGREVGFILQDALVSLDPLRPVGAEIAETLRLHGWRSRSARRAKVIDLLDAVGVPSPELRARQRSGQLSGGLRQRALIASALALDPDVIIADEPTTALDVTVQAQVLDLLEQSRRRGASIILISHDLSVVAQLADHILVMQDGRVVEQGPASVLLREPARGVHQGAHRRGAERGDPGCGAEPGGRRAARRGDRACGRPGCRRPGRNRARGPRPRQALPRARRLGRRPPSTTSRSRSGAARPWASWGSRARARARPAASPSRSRRPMPAR